MSSSLNGLRGSLPPSFGDLNGDVGESRPESDSPSVTPFRGVDVGVPPSATVGKPSTELLFLCDPLGDFDFVLTVSDFFVAGDAASYSRSCDVDVSPSSFIRRILEPGDSSDSCRGALALSSLCMAATRSMGSPPGARGLDRAPGGESLGVSVALPGAPSFLSKATDFDFRIFKLSSLRFAAASRSAAVFMSVWTLSNVTKKSATSRKIRPALSALNGSPKNSVTPFMASSAEVASRLASTTWASAESAKGIMTSLNLSWVSSVLVSVSCSGSAPAALRTSSLTCLRPDTIWPSASLVPSRWRLAASLTDSSSVDRNSTPGEVFCSSLTTKCSKLVFLSTALTSVSRRRVSSLNPLAWPR